MTGVDLLTVLAADPRTPTRLLQAIPTAPGPVLRTRTRFFALAANPAISPAQLTALRDKAPDGVSRDMLREACARDGITAQVAVDMLGKDHDDDLAIVLSVVPDPDRHLARHALTHATCHTPLLMSLDTRTPPAELNWDLTTRLVQLCPDTGWDHDQVMDAVTHAVTDRLAWAATPGEHTTARQWATHLADLAPPALAATIAQVLREHPTWAPAAPGEDAWLSNPATPTDHVLAWASTATDHQRALTQRRDVDGRLARAAFAAHPHHPDVLKLLVDPGRPDDVRLHAAANLPPAPKGTKPAFMLHADTAVIHADPDIAVRLVLDTPDTSRLPFLMLRRDLTADHLQTLLDGYRRHYMPTAKPVLHARFGVWLAVQPAATDTQRRRGQEMALAVDPAYVGTKPWHVLARALDRGSILHTPTQAHLPSNTGSQAVHHALATEVLDRLGPDPSPDTITALTALADDFTGTVAELIDTAHTTAT